MTADDLGGDNSLQDLVKKILVESIQSLSPQAQISKNEMDALTGICMMGVAVNGTEDPRTLMRDVTDLLLEHIVKNRDGIKKNQILGKIHQLFLIEWCYRNGHLKGDWAWRWEGPKEGKLFYKPRTPLEKVKFPDP